MVAWPGPTRPAFLAWLRERSLLGEEKILALGPDGWEVAFSITFATSKHSATRVRENQKKIAANG